MAAANPAKRLREEASCSICLDYFTDPVLTDCGHNFCRSCITQSWEGRDTNFPCPLCRKMSQKKKIRPNRQMANVTEIMKKFCPNPELPKEETRDEEQAEKFQLICKEEKKINGVCNESQNHRSHTVIPIEAAVQLYKNKFKMCLEPLRKKLEDLVKFKASEEKKAEELMGATEIKRQKIVSDFEELHQLLNKEKWKLLSRLEEKEKKILQRIRENVAQLEEQSSAIMQLISEIEQKSQQPAAELLMDVKDTLSRYQNMEFPEPNAVSTDLKMGFQLSYPQQLKKLITKFGESPQTSSLNAPIIHQKDIIVSPVVKSLNPTAQPVPRKHGPLPSPNRTSTKERQLSKTQPGRETQGGAAPPAQAVSREVPQRLPQPSKARVQAQTAAAKSQPSAPQPTALGCHPSELWMEYCKHAADVTLDPETAHPWLVLSEDRKSVRCGDTKQDVPDTAQRFDYSLCVLGGEGFTSGRHYWEVEVGDKTDWELGLCKDSVSRRGRITLSPGEGYWVVRLRYGDEYRALTSPVTRLRLSERPQAVGILLDYDMGKVSFYDAETKSHLFTFTDTFRGTLRAFFCPGYNCGTVRIRDFRAKGSKSHQPQSPSRSVSEEISK